ncbi:inositol monophosphatase family protein [Cardiobacterium hominis]|uniref:Inositol-1-monophosphatase n=1 Tax=Cardiobacterium hominis TaxID=2718 RepID=A0A1C3H2A9_9GAMM|nr:inositol monophosphatase family protein [Cardiobacterium hominis]SAM57672.1 Inositol-1-monophosphatase [Cardiobacterium hominis]
MATNPMLTIARRAAEEAGKILQMGQRQLDQIQIEEKGRGDLVSVVDRRAEEVIKNILLEKFPQHDFLGEEFGETRAQAEESEFCWVIDPLDGTTNFLHGLPQFAVSIGLLKRGKPELGVVYNPATEEWFTAARGEGAQLNGRKLRVSGLRDGGRAIVATGFPFRYPDLMPRQYALLQSVLQEIADVRRLGSASLDLCFVAANRVDAFFEMGLKPWDICAGILIAQEAGAIVTDLAGQHTMLDSGNIVAANTYLHSILLQQIAAA